MTRVMARTIVGTAIIAMLLDAAVASAGFSPVPPVALTTSGHASAAPRSVVAVGANDLVAAYSEGRAPKIRVYVRRSGNGGATWSAPVRISGAGERGGANRASLHSDGSIVDAVWAQGGQYSRRGSSCTNLVMVCRLTYARSADGGVSFSRTRALSAQGTVVGFSQVARRGDVVAVVWTEWAPHPGRVKVRISQDGGATFGREQLLGRTTNRAFEDSPRDAWVTVAIGGGTVYVAWFRDDHTLLLRRWGFAEADWTSPTVITSRANGFAGVSVTAGADDALLAYSRFDRRRTWSVSQATENDGASWSAPRAITTGSTVPWSGNAVLERVANGHYLAHLVACTTAKCSKWALFVRETTDRGATWPAGYKSTPVAMRKPIFPTSIVKSSRVVAGFVRYTKGSYDVMIRAAEHDTPSPANHRRRRR